MAYENVNDSIEMAHLTSSSPSKASSNSQLKMALSAQLKLLNDERSYKAENMGLSCVGNRSMGHVRELLNLADLGEELNEDNFVALCAISNETFLDIQECLTRDGQRAFAENYLFIRDRRNAFPVAMHTLATDKDSYSESTEDIQLLLSTNGVRDSSSFRADGFNEANFAAIKAKMTPEAAEEFQFYWNVSKANAEASSAEAPATGIGIKNLASSHMKMTHVLLAIAQSVLIVMYAVFGGTESFPTDFFSDTDTSTRALDGYNLYVGVMIMMIIGFGYLMTFMKYYGLGAVGFCLLVTALGLQYGILVESFFYMWYENDWGKVPLDMYNIYIVTAAVAAPLISLGAVIGKITPFQLTVMVLIEFAFHALLSHVFLYGILEVTDIGATYGIHMFGCYFGLAVAYILGPAVKEPDGANVSDLFSLIGTLFLWVYWPSFVGGFLEVDSSQQQHALANTILCLCASTVTAYIGSSFFNPTRGSSRFRPVDIQNATLAGGVAVGALADLRMNPGITLLVGAASGLISSFGYCHIQPYLCEKFNLHDTCGVNNLHGMPSILGALVSVWVAGVASDPAQREAYHYRQPRQAIAQFAGLLFCLAFSVIAGLITGKVLKFFDVPEGVDPSQFHDAVWWEIAGEEEPDAASAEKKEKDNKILFADNTV